MDLKKWRQRLLQEQQELETLSDDASEARGTVTLDQQGVGRLSRMDAMQQQAIALESERRRRMRLKRIDAALQRIEQDEFGYCVKCGEVIPDARLNADPTNPLCVGCAGNPIPKFARD